MRCFAAALTALQAAELIATNCKTINRIYLGLRQRIHAACEERRPMFGVVEVDERLFCPRRTGDCTKLVSGSLRAKTELWWSATTLEVVNLFCDIFHRHHVRKSRLVCIFLLSLCFIFFSSVNIPIIGFDQKDEK